MFVLASKYNLLVVKMDFLTQRLNKLQRQWNDLIDRINAKGGEAFLNSKPLQFSDDEIKQMIVLCHPDKHGGSKSAHDITARLLSMRRKSSNKAVSGGAGAPYTPRAGSGRNQEET